MAQEIGFAQQSNEVKAQIAAFIAKEFGSRDKDRELGTPNRISDDGMLKFMISADEARRLLITLEQGEVPDRQPSDLSAWLATNPKLIKNLDGLEHIARIDSGDPKCKFRESFVRLAKDDVKKLPIFAQPHYEFVDASIKGGAQGVMVKKMLLHESGDAQIYVSPQEARDALSIANGERILGRLSGTATLLRHNLDLIQVVDKDGKAMAPVEAIRQIAESRHRSATVIKISPERLISSVDRQVNPKAFGKAFIGAMEESMRFELARKALVEYAAKQGSRREALSKSSDKKNGVTL